MAGFCVSVLRLDYGSGYGRFAIDEDICWGGLVGVVGYVHAKSPVGGKRLADVSSIGDKGGNEHT